MIHDRDHSFLPCVGCGSPKSELYRFSYRDPPGLTEVIRVLARGQSRLSPSRCGRRKAFSSRKLLVREEGWYVKRSPTCSMKTHRTGPPLNRWKPRSDDGCRGQQTGTVVLQKIQKYASILWHDTLHADSCDNEKSKKKGS